jgi:hypothetical protein
VAARFSFSRGLAKTKIPARANYDTDGDPYAGEKISRSCHGGLDTMDDLMGLGKSRLRSPLASRLMRGFSRRGNRFAILYLF